MLLQCLMLALLMAAPALAQTYPDRPIRYVIPFPPAGLTDVLARNDGQKLAERRKQPVVIVAKNNADTNAVLAEPEMRKRIVEQGFSPMPMTAAEAKAFVDGEVVRWGKLVREANIRPD